MKQILSDVLEFLKRFCSLAKHVLCRLQHRKEFVDHHFHLPDFLTKTCRNIQIRLANRNKTLNKKMKKKSQESCLAAGVVYCCLKVSLLEQRVSVLLISVSLICLIVFFSFSVSKKWFQPHKFQPCGVNLKTLRLDANFSQFRSKIFSF